MSSFDPATFLETSYEDEIDTTIIPIPEDDHPAQVEKLMTRQFEGKDGILYTVMDVLWHITAPEVAEHTKNEKPMARQSLFIDITEQGSIDMSKGKNRQLGLLRKALNQNKAGKAWNPNMLINAPAKVRIKQRVDPDDSEMIYSEVKKVLPL